MSIQYTKLISTCFVGATIACVPVAQADSCLEKGVIEVVGTSKVEVMPDLAVISLVAKDSNTDATKARQVVEKKVTSIVNTAKSLGLKTSDMVSGSISLYPKYHYDKDSKQIFDSYVATRSITFKVSDFSLIEKITSSAIESDITEVNGIRYELKDSSKVQIEADSKAMLDATNKAKRLAQGFDVKIKKPCSLKFNDQGSPMVYRNRVSAPTLLSAKNSVHEEVTEYIPEILTVESSVYAAFAIDK